MTHKSGLRCDAGLQLHMMNLPFQGTGFIEKDIQGGHHIPAGDLPIIA